MAKDKKGISAVFLDRDGTLNEDINYLGKAADMRLIPGAAGAVHMLNQRSIPVLVVTNQSGVAQGLHTESDVKKVHAEISKQLKKADAHIDRFYYCPHHPDGKGKHAVACECRKPRPGLLLQAAQELHLDLSRCVMVGDAARDIEAGVAAGCRTVLVRTGKGTETWNAWRESFKPSHVAADLSEAAKWILGLKA